MKRTSTIARLRGLLLLICMCMSGMVYGALSGTYSINSGAPASATNYTSVSAAISDLMTGVRADGGPINGPGVTGPVTLRLAAGTGPYTEQVSIGAIPGTSSTNYVRITGGPTRETIQFTNTTTTDRHVIRLSGTKNIILDSLTLINASTSFGYGVWITNNSDSNYVQNSYIHVDSSTTSSNFAGVTISGSTPTTLGNNGDYNTIQNNVISGGYYSVSINGSSTTVYSQRNYILNNTLKSFYYYGIRCYEQEYPQINQNIIYARTNGTTAAYGMYVYYCKDFLVERNRVTRVGTYNIYIAYANYLNSVVGGVGNVRNNLIGGTTLNSGATYGLYLTTQSNNVNIYHNSVSINSGNGRCIYILAGSGINVRNNSFAHYNSGTGYAAYVSATTYISQMDFNNYYCPGSSNFVYVGAAFTPATVIGGGGYNVNSRVGDPNYKNPVSNLHAFATQLWDAGDPSVNVSDDYDGDVRPHPLSVIPDIGADEYLPDSIDLSPVALLEPANYLCPDSFQTISVVLSNKGINAQSNIPIRVTVTGTGATVINYVHPGPMPLGDMDTVIVGTTNTWPGGIMYVDAVTLMPGDQDGSNDSVRFTRSIGLTLPSPSAVNDTICEGDSTLLVSNGTGANYWYDALTGGNLVTAGDSLYTGSLSATTTYYAETRGTSTNTQTTTFANNNSCGGGNMFDIFAINDVVVDSFDLNMNAGTVNVDVYYKAGSYAGFETNAGAWTLLGSASATSTGTGVPTRLRVGGLNIPQGQTYAIYIYTTAIVYTTLGTTTTYSGPDMNVTCGIGLCNLFGGTNNPRGWNGTVYYSAEGCASNRTAMTVHVNPLPTTTLTDSAYCGFALLDAGNPGATYAWSNGDLTQTTAVTSSGMYSVSVLQNGCSATDSANITVNPNPFVSLGTSQTLCDGATATLDAGNAGSSFAWSTGDTSQTITVSAAGTYSVAVTDSNGCMGMDSVALTTGQSPVSGIAVDTSGCPVIQFTGDNIGGAASTWLWNFGDGGSAATSNATHTYGANGTYNVTYSLTNDCGTDSATVTVTISCIVGIEQGQFAQASIYPNPTTGNAILEVMMPSNASATLRISDLQGKTHAAQELELVNGKNQVQLNLNELSAGVYFIDLKSEVASWQGRIVKE